MSAQARPGPARAAAVLCHRDSAVLTLPALFSRRFIVPISCVICNDIMAYMFGFFFGRTPLIKVGSLDPVPLSQDWIRRLVPAR